MNHLHTKVLVTALTASAIGGVASAATFFTEDFSDNSAGPNMALGAGFGSPTTDFTGDFTITSGTGNRTYLGTNDTDYSTVDFVFEADVTITQNSDWSIVFFGIGNPDADGAAFGEPVTGPNALASLRPSSSSGINSKDNTINSFDSAGETSITQANMLGTHLLRLTWDSVTGSATFEIDLAKNGTVDSTFVIDGSDNGFNASNSQLILGGGNQTSFDNISIVPEPGSLALLGLGGLCILQRRRN